MVFSTRDLARRVAAAICAPTLVFLLVACGSGVSSKTTVGTTHHASTLMSAPTPTPTPKVAVATYSGFGFTVHYPATWKKSSSRSEVAFTDSQGIYNMTIGFASDPNGAVTANQLADGGIKGAKANLKHSSMLQVAPMMTLSNSTWSQRAISGISAINGHNMEVEGVVLATIHPASGAHARGYIIVYVALKDQFSQATDMYFMPMLQSLKFIS